MKNKYFAELHLWYYPDDMDEPYFDPNRGYILKMDNDLESLIKNVMEWLNQMKNNKLEKSGDETITNIKMVNKHYTEYEYDNPERDPKCDTFILAEINIETVEEDEPKILTNEETYRLVIRKYY